MADAVGVPPTEPTCTPDAHVDADRIRGLKETLGDVASELVELYERTAADTLAELRAATESGASDDVRRLAHRLKGGSRNVGAVGLGDLSLAIEQGDVDAAAGVERLAAAIAPACRALRAAIA